MWRVDPVLVGVRLDHVEKVEEGVRRELRRLGSREEYGLEFMDMSFHGAFELINEAL
jgi:hypothetical protein